MLQAKFGLTTPEERVLRFRNTLRNFTEADVREPLSIVPVTRYNQQGRLIVMNGKPVMLLTEGDLDEGDDLTLDQAAQRVLARMEAQRMALRDQYDTGWLALSTVKTAAGAVAALLRRVAILALVPARLPSAYCGESQPGAAKLAAVHWRN